MKRILIIGSPRHSKELMLAIARSHAIHSSMPIFNFQFNDRTAEEYDEHIKNWNLAIGRLGISAAEAGRRFREICESIQELKANQPIPPARKSVIPNKFHRGKNNYKK